MLLLALIHWFKTILLYLWTIKLNYSLWIKLKWSHILKKKKTEGGLWAMLEYCVQTQDKKIPFWICELRDYIFYAHECCDVQMYLNMGSGGRGGAELTESNSWSHKWIQWIWMKHSVTIHILLVNPKISSGGAKAVGDSILLRSGLFLYGNQWHLSQKAKTLISRIWVFVYALWCSSSLHALDTW